MTGECYAVGLYQDGKLLERWDKLDLGKAKRIYRAYFDDPDFGVVLFREGERLKARDAWRELGMTARIRLVKVDDRVYRVREVEKV